MEKEIVEVELVNDEDSTEEPVSREELIDKKETRRVGTSKSSKKPGKSLKGEISESERENKRGFEKVTPPSEEQVKETGAEDALPEDEPKIEH